MNDENHSCLQSRSKSKKKKKKGSEDDDEDEDPTEDEDTTEDEKREKYRLSKMPPEEATVDVGSLLIYSFYMTYHLTFPDEGSKWPKTLDIN